MNYEKANDRLKEVGAAVCLSDAEGIVLSTSPAAKAALGIACGDDMHRYIFSESAELGLSTGDSRCVEVIFECAPSVESAVVCPMDDACDTLIWFFIFGDASEYLPCSSSASLERFLCRAVSLFGRTLASGTAGVSHPLACADTALEAYELIRHAVGEVCGARDALCEVNSAMEILRSAFLEYGCYTGFLADVEVVGMSEEQQRLARESSSSDELEQLDGTPPAIFFRYPPLETGYEALPEHLFGYPAVDSEGESYSFLVDIAGLLLFAVAIALFAQRESRDGCVHFEIGMDSWHRDTALIMNSEYTVAFDADSAGDADVGRGSRRFLEHTRLLCGLNERTKFNYELSFAPRDEGFCVIERTVLPIYAVRDDELGFRSTHEPYVELSGTCEAIMYAAEAFIELFGSEKALDPFPGRLMRSK